MSVIINTIAIIFFIIGLIFFTGGTVGIIRMPDFYTRLHPAGKLDTMGLMSFVIGFFYLQSPALYLGKFDCLTQDVINSIFLSLFPVQLPRTPL